VRPQRTAKDTLGEGREVHATAPADSIVSAGKSTTREGET
jgi:hypothetical protein